MYIYMGDCCTREANREQDSDEQPVSVSDLHSAATFQKSAKTPVSSSLVRGVSSHLSTPGSAFKQIGSSDLSEMPLLAIRLQHSFFDVYDLDASRPPLVSTALGSHKMSKELRWVRVVSRIQTKRQRISPEENLRHQLKAVVSLSNPCLLQPTSVLYTRREMYVLSENFTNTNVISYKQIAKSQAESTVKSIASQLLRMMAYLHAQGIILKTLSLPMLLFYQGTTDETLVKYLGIGGWETPDRVENSNGMLNPALYKSPEGDLGDEKGDIWSCGMILLVLLTGQVPAQARVRAVVEVGVEFNEKIWWKFDPNAQRLISGMLSPNPTERPSVLECLSHPWLQSSVSSVPPSLRPALVNLRHFQHFNPLKLSISSFLVNHAIPAAEKKSTQDVFHYINSSSSGRISLTELMDAFAKVHRTEFSQSLATDLFRAVDLDSNGSIDYSEFLTTSLDQSMFTNTTYLRTAFSIIDPEFTGKITLEEVNKALKQSNTAQLQEIIKKIKKTEDEKLTFKDFKQIVFLALNDFPSNRRVSRGLTSI